MRILFAEDDKRLSKMIDFLLKKENYIVDCVYNGQDAIDYANLSDYDIIILDWMMPLKSGIEVCRYLRAKNNQTIKYGGKIYVLCPQGSGGSLVGRRE